MTWRIVVAGLVLAASPASAQIADTPQREQPTISTTIDATLLGDLPTSDNLSSILETTQPSLTSDRFSEGGLFTGQSARIGGFFSPAAETRFRLGDVDLSDPTGSGVPLLVPDVAFWQRVNVSTGMMPMDLNAPGVEISLDPLVPTTMWTRSVFAAGAPFDPAASSTPPAIARLDTWGRIGGAVSGPLLTDSRGLSRLRALVAATWTRGSQFDRGEPSAAQATIGSGFAELLFTPTRGDEVRTIVWVQQTTYPFDERVLFNQPGATTTDSAAHVQASWDRRASQAWRMRMFGGYTGRQSTPDYVASQNAVVERTTDGPVSLLSGLSQNDVRQWSAGLRLMPVAESPRRHTIHAGIDVGGANERSSSFFSGLANELVDGTLARLWRFTAPGIDSVRHETNFAAYVSDRVEVARRLALNAGIRFDATSGSADGAVNGVSWQSWLPRADLDWTLAEHSATTAFIGVGRSADRLTLDTLAVGDPAAPTADIFTPSGVLVARTGPGTDGNPTFSRIDPNLKRPSTDEFVIGLESHLGHALRMRVAGFARRESNLLGLVDTGAPVSAYTQMTVPDAGLDGEGQMLPVYNRLPASFGKDRYLLTNPSEDDATSKSFEISGSFDTTHIVLFGGATASMANGPAASVGDGSLENNQSVLGDLFIDPNAATFASGRLFVDRAYTIKVGGVFRLPGGIHAGAIARYQDGQPFARLVVVPGLNQGTELVRAFPNGDSRFTFTETVDAQLQKGFAIGGVHVDGIVDAFNLFNRSNEVDEQTITGATFRAVTAVQPPRTLHVGFRVSF